MPYPVQRLEKIFLSGTLTLLIAADVNAAAPSQNYFHSPFSVSHILESSALYNYNGDTVLGHSSSGFIRRDRNGDLVVAVPQTTQGRYKVRFFDEEKNLLFEIRQIVDPLLIIEKYNFRHAGRFLYELYRDNTLIERSSFVITL